MSRTLVYLVPGFFGFRTLGTLSYFHRVAGTLARILKDEHGLEVTVVECRSKPTASIAWRAEALLQEVLATGGLAAETLHFVGHSMGGLDARLLLAPGAKLLPAAELAQIQQKTRSLTTVATPHYGTPLAGFFTTLPGRHALRLVASLATRNLSRKTLLFWAHVVTGIARLEAKLGRTRSILRYWAERALVDLSPDPKHPIWEYLAELALDQGAIVQLTPEAMHLFNAALAEPKVACGCVVTGVRRPRLKDVLRHVFRPYAVSTELLFYVIHRLTARKHPRYPYAAPAGDERAALEHALRATTASDAVIDDRTNDGVAPTLSQVHGRVLFVADSDHLDVVGQFQVSGGESLADWMASGSTFGEAEFQAVWRAVAAHIARAEGVTAPAG